MGTVNYPGQLNVRGFPGFSGYTLKLIRKNAQLVSPYSGKRQVVANPFALWNFVGKYSITDETQANWLRSFFAQLQGSANKFRLPIAGAKPKTGYNGCGFVNAGGQTGNSLVCFANSASTQIFAPGDYFTVNGELKIVRTACFIDGASAFTVVFDPPLKASPPAFSQLRLGYANNYTLNNTDFTQSSWNKILCTAPTGFPTPDINAISNSTLAINSTGVAGTVQVSQPAYLGPLANRTFTFSIYIKNSTVAANISVFLNDINNTSSFQTTNSVGFSWTRYTVTGTFPANCPSDTVYFGILYTAPASVQGCWLDYPYLEEASSASSPQLATDGEGPVSFMAALTNDDGGSWDLSPPILSQFSLDATEVFE